MTDRLSKHPPIRRALLLIAGVLALATAPLAQPSPHQRALQQHRDHPVLDALIGPGGRPSVPLLPRARPATEHPVVFGYLPYWIDADYYQNLDFGLLTHISAFSVEVNPDGSIGNDHGWPWTALVDRAHAHGVYVILTATLFGDGPVLELIGDPTHRQTFFRQIRQRILDGGADGLNIDFEGPGANGWPAQIADFMAELTAYLHAEIPGCQVSFAAPAVDWGNRWDHEALANSCDYLFIMGYAFSGGWSDTSGPTAPLTGGWRNITTTVTGDSDFGTVTRQSPKKLILGVPYYGCLWQTEGPQARAFVSAFVEYPRLRQTLPEVTVHGRTWDATSSTPWYAYEADGQWHQAWYDDAVSLGLKYDLALDADLLGIGMWALGYEGDRREPWDLLAAKIGRRPAPTAVLAETPPHSIELAQNHPNPFNSATHIAYQLPGDGLAEIQIFDALGRRVALRQRQHQGAGRYTWRWDGTDAQGRPVSSGTYFYRLVFRDGNGKAWRQARRMVLVR